MSFVSKVGRGDNKVTGDEKPYWPLAKLDCFNTQKKCNEFTFSQAQTSLRGGLIKVNHLLLAYDLYG